MQHCRKLNWFVNISESRYPSIFLNETCSSPFNLVLYRVIALYTSERVGIRSPHANFSFKVIHEILYYSNDPKFLDRLVQANSGDSAQTAP